MITTLNQIIDYRSLIIMSHHYSKCYKKIRLLYMLEFVSEMGVLTVFKWAFFTCEIVPYILLQKKKKREIPLYKPLQKKDLRGEWKSGWISACLLAVSCWAPWWGLFLLSQVLSQFLLLKAEQPVRVSCLTGQLNTNLTCQCCTEDAHHTGSSNTCNKLFIEVNAN